LAEETKKVSNGTDNLPVMDLEIDRVQVGERHRKELGDIEALAQSIRELGMLQPLILSPDRRLVAGLRRMEAAKMLGMKTVPVRIVQGLADARLALLAERDENVCRKDLTPSEAVEIGRTIEELEQEAAKQRQREHGHTAPGRKGNTSGNLPEVSDNKGRTRDKVAEAVGMSGRTYEKAKAVVEAAQEDPEKYGPAQEEMDATGKVDPAFKKVQKGRAASNGGEAAEGRPGGTTVRIRLPAEQHDRVRKAAEEAGLSVPQFAVKSVFAAALAVERCLLCGDSLDNLSVPLLLFETDDEP
jgi:hypothetical protein